MQLFALATLLPVCLIGAASVWGGLWGVAALAYMTAVTATLDEVTTRLLPDDGDNNGAEFPAGNGLAVVLALAHFGLLGLAVAGLSGTGLGALEKLALFLSAGLFFGQVSNSNAHELIHRGRRGLHRLGMWVYISMLFGHHTSAHVLVHHVQVGTRADPNTARLGESLYRFWVRAWIGSFKAGYRAETARLTRAGRPMWRHPYNIYFAGAVLCLGVAAQIGGAMGALAYLGLAGFAQMQLIMNDYVQHYGLARATRANGKPEPVNTAHSWNSPHRASSALMLNAPRHSDHHAHPARAYPALRLPGNAPMLPRSVPVMACVALYPRLWRRVMDPRARAWQQAAT